MKTLDNLLVHARQIADSLEALEDSEQQLILSLAKQMACYNRIRRRNMPVVDEIKVSKTCQDAITAHS